MQSILHSDRANSSAEVGQEAIEFHYLAVCQHPTGRDEHVMFSRPEEALTEAQVLQWLSTQETAVVPHNIHVWAHPSRINCVLGLVEYREPTQLH